MCVRWAESAIKTTHKEKVKYRWMIESANHIALVLTQPTSLIHILYSSVAYFALVIISYRFRHLVRYLPGSNNVDCCTFVEILFAGLSSADLCDISWTCRLSFRRSSGSFARTEYTIYEGKLLIIPNTPREVSWAQFYSQYLYNNDLPDWVNSNCKIFYKDGA